MNSNLSAGVCLFALVCLAGGAQAATRTVGAGGDLQAALNAAQPGDTILIQAGAVFTGNFWLPAKSGTADIIVRSSAPDSSLPPPGVRITPAYASLLPKIRSDSNGPALRTASGTAHWRLMFLEFLPAPGTSTATLVELGRTGSAQTSLTSVPHHLVVDRCYLHGDPTAGQRRGIGLNGANTQVINSYFKDFKGVRQDTQAIAGWNGPGPYLIENNYLEAAGENLMFGGSAPSIPNLVPSHITIRRNHITRPLAWMSQSWTVKNLIELKNAQDVVIEGNIIENHWVAGQQGSSIVFTPRNQGGTAPWTVVKNVLVQNNIIRHVAAVFNIAGYDDSATSQQTRNITIRNNLIYDVSTKYTATSSSATGRLALIGGGPAEIVFDHNTVDNNGSSTIFFYGGYAPTGKQIYGFRLTNNLLRRNTYGVFGDQIGEGTVAFSAYTPNALVLRNTFANGPASKYPTGNFFPTLTQWRASFVDASAGKYTLVTGCPWIDAGTDGKDLGVDFAELNAAQSGSAPPSVSPDPDPSSGTAPPPGAGTVVVWTANVPASNLHGRFTRISDASAAGGAALWNANKGAAKIVPALANPANYFETTFTATAGTAYHVWVRLRAENNALSNDSVHLQFNDSVTSSGSATMRIGSTSSAEFVLQNGSSDTGDHAWGWADNGWGSLGPHVYFATTGTHTVRVQQREDGAVIDQIVLSPDAYLSTPPGPRDNDTTILASSPAPSSSSKPTIVLWTAATPAGDVHGRWSLLADSTAAGGSALWNSDAGQAKITPALASPANYFERTFDAAAGTAYHLWIRLRAQNNAWSNDSIHVQFSDAVDAGGSPTMRIGSSGSAQVVLQNGSSDSGDHAWGWADNGWGALGAHIYFATSGTHRIRIQQREDGAIVDQIVLSPSAYLTSPPGARDYDTTILR